MRFVFEYFKKYKIQCLIGPLFKVFEVVFELMVPFIIADIIDKGVKLDNEAYIKSSVILLVIFSLVGFSCTLLAQYMSAYAAINICSDMREDTFGKILSLRIKEVDKIGTSRLLTTLSSDINQIQVGINLTLRLLLRSPFVVLGAVIMALIISYKAALIFVGVVIGLTIIIILNFRRSMPAYKAVRTELDNIVTETDDGLTGARVIRGFLQTENEARNYREHTKKLNKLQKDSARITTILNPLTFLIVNAFLTLLIYTGAIEAGNGVLTPGQVVSLYSYLNMILVELLKLTNLIIQISRALACASRVSALIDIKDDAPRSDTERCDGLISFKDVTFSYSSEDTPAIRDIDLTLRKGETLGIIGKTGSGKSTLGAVIASTYDPTSGKISYHDGRPLRVGYCLQKTRLFSGTLDYNIRLDREEITDEDVDFALDFACCRDFVKDKSMMLTESGKNLSGGQRQRVNIARAVASRPDILILDDASASLDAITERRLIHNMETMAPDLAKVIISQKIKSVKNCDQIFVMDEGRIVDRGTHEELLSGSRIYREMYDLQTKEVTA